MSSDDRTLRRLFKRLFDNPFFTILFLSEYIKMQILGKPVPEFGLLALGSAVLWVLSDAVDVDIDFGSIIG